MDIEDIVENTSFDGARKWPNLTQAQQEADRLNSDPIPFTKWHAVPVDNGFSVLMVSVEP